MIGDAAQYQELVALYSSYGDGELLELGRGMADLTEMAQEALKGELTRRGLKIAPAERVEVRVLTEEDLADMRSYAEIAPPECIFEFEDEKGASDAYYTLTANGIEAIVVSAGGSRFGNRKPRAVVTPKDAEEFALPRCPACGGDETLLEAVDPVNKWHCDRCDHTWLEDAASSVP
jgi:hypothetical protein